MDVDAVDTDISLQRAQNIEKYFLGAVDTLPEFLHLPKYRTVVGLEFSQLNIKRQLCVSLYQERTISLLPHKSISGYALRLMRGALPLTYERSTRA